MSKDRAKDRNLFLLSDVILDKARSVYIVNAIL